jgi:hypothetical protein
MKSGHESEAFAQAKKGANTLRDVRSGYKDGMNLDIKDLPPNLEKAMEVIDKAKVDVNATGAHLKRLNDELKSLDYSDVSEVSKDISKAFNDLKEFDKKK